LAESAKDAIRSACEKQSAEDVTHIFIAAPNALTFFLGQRTPVLGSIRLYEYDFEGGHNRSYSPSMTLAKST